MCVLWGKSGRVLNAQPLPPTRKMGISVQLTLLSNADASSGSASSPAARRSSFCCLRFWSHRAWSCFVGQAAKRNDNTHPVQYQGETVWNVPTPVYPAPTASQHRVGIRTYSTATRHTNHSTAAIYQTIDRRLPHVTRRVHQTPVCLARHARYIAPVYYVSLSALTWLSEPRAGGRAPSGFASFGVWSCCDGIHYMDTGWAARCAAPRRHKPENMAFRSLVDAVLEYRKCLGQYPILMQALRGI